MTNNRSQSNFSSLGDIMKGFKKDEDKYISREFQKYGCDLADELGDSNHKSLYIKLAKVTPRAFLENARNYIKDAYNVKSKPKLFMWKLNQLKNLKTEKLKNGELKDKKT